MRVPRRLKRLSGQIVKRFDTVHEPSSMLWWEGYLWIASSRGNNVSRLSPHNEEVITAQVGMNPQQIAVMEDYLQVICQGDSQLVKLGLDGQVIETILVYANPSPILSSEGNDGPVALSVAGEMTWLAYPKANMLTSIDKEGLRSGFFTAMGEPHAITFEAGYLWVADGITGTVTQRDTEGAVLVTFPVGKSLSVMISDGTSLWVADRASATVARIDP